LSWFWGKVKEDSPYEWLTSRTDHEFIFDFMVFFIIFRFIFLKFSKNQVLAASHEVLSKFKEPFPLSRIEHI